MVLLKWNLNVSVGATDELNARCFEGYVLEDRVPFFHSSLICDLRKNETILKDYAVDMIQSLRKDHVLKFITIRERALLYAKQTVVEHDRFKRFAVSKCALTDLLKV